jgi:hypothetical protein
MLWRLFVWLTPLWCAGIVAMHWNFGGSDDPYWWTSLSLAGILSAICFAQRRQRLAFYCLAVVLLILLISVLLPIFNRAT